MTDDDFRFDRQPDGVATLTFDRPDTLNSLTFGIYGRLERLFVDLRTDDSVKVIVITGAGKGFCSGGDVDGIIAPLLDRNLEGTLEFTRMTGAVVYNMRRLNKPIIAAVNGIAAGAGAVIALASDLRVLSEKASFAFLFTKVGLTGADMGAAHLLPGIVGAGRAAELLMLGEKIDAAECLRIGLANRVLPGDQLEVETRNIAHRLATGPTQALAMTKRLLVDESYMGLQSAIELEALAQGIMLRAHDHREFYQAWKDKRQPRFEGR